MMDRLTRRSTIEIYESRDKAWSTRVRFDWSRYHRLDRTIVRPRENRVLEYRTAYLNVRTSSDRRHVSHLLPNAAILPLGKKVPATAWPIVRNYRFFFVAVLPGQFRRATLAALRSQTDHFAWLRNRLPSFTHGGSFTESSKRNWTSMHDEEDVRKIDYARDR